MAKIPSRAANAAGDSTGADFASSEPAASSATTLSAELITTGKPLVVEPMANARWKISGLPAVPPDDLAPVIRIEFEGPPYRLAFSDGGWLDGAYTATPEG